MIFIKGKKLTVFQHNKKFKNVKRYKYTKNDLIRKVTEIPKENKESLSKSRRFFHKSMF